MYLTTAVPSASLQPQMGGHQGLATAARVLAHMMDCDFRQHAYTLTFEPMTPEQTGENLVQFLRGVTED